MPRERREDIPLLARHFLRILSLDMNREPCELSEGALAGLMAYDFPGNVRELKNVMERALIKARGEAIGPEHLVLGQPVADASAGSAPSVVSADLPLDLERALEWAEEEVVRRALAESDDNVSAASRLLGTNRPRVYRAMERLRRRR